METTSMTCMLCNLQLPINLTYVHAQPNYVLCYNCLFNSLRKDDLSGLKHSKTIPIKYCDEKIDISLVKIIDILSNLITQGTEVSPIYCTSHHTILDFYCIDCKIETCSSCEINKHKGHKSYTYQELTEKLNCVPPFYLLNLNEIELKYKEESIKFLCDYNNFLLSKERDTSQLIEKMKEEIENCDLILKIIRLFYTKFYSDIKKPAANLNELIFLSKINVSVPKLHFVLNEEIQDIAISLKEFHYCNFINTQIATGHNDWVNVLIQLQDGRIASGSSDNTIKIWEMSGQALRCTHTLKGHARWVTELLQMKCGLLISGSTDYSMRLWEVGATAFYCIQVLDHSWDEFLVYWKDEQIITQSAWGLNIWKLTNRFLTCVSQLDFSFFRWTSNIITLKDGSLACTSSNTTMVSIATLIMNSFHYFQSDRKSRSSIRCLIQLKDGRLISGSDNGKIKIWTYMENIVIKKGPDLKSHESMVNRIIQLKDGRVASGSTDKTIRIWEMKGESFACTHVLKGHLDSVKSLLQLNDGRLLSGACDKTIRIWEPMYEEIVIKGES